MNSIARKSVVVLSLSAGFLVALPQTARAAVGRPLTPVSYAGVARRSTVETAPVAAAAPLATAAVVTAAVVTPGVGAPGVGVAPGVGAPGVGAPGVNAGGPVNRVGIR